MVLKYKKGDILIEDIIFLILNLAFLSILVLFILKQGLGVIVLEEFYAKQTALLIDSSEESSRLMLDVSEGVEIGEKNGIPPSEIISINGNIVTVKLSEDSGYSYSFFNDVSVNTGLEDGRYVFVINEREEDE